MNVSFDICKSVSQCIPNSFCGRSCGAESIGNYSLESCGACPWGSKANWPDATDNCSLCTKCSDIFSTYDWLFVLFNMLMVFLIHVQGIFRFSVQSYRNLIMELGCALIELLMGFLISIFTFAPFGSLSITACYQAKQLTLHYWYYFLQAESRDNLFFNPFQDEVENISCIYETVYPRYSIIISGFCSSFFFTLFLRPLFIYYTNTKQSEKVIPLPLQYAAFSSALLILPIYIIIFVCGGGLLYFNFGYLVLLCSVFGISFYSSLATPTDFTLMVQFKSTTKHIPAIISHLLVLMFAVWSILSHNDGHYVVLCATFVPFLFLISTDYVTHPHVQHAERSWHTDYLEK